MIEKNNKLKHEAAKPVLTDRVCSQCDERIASTQVAMLKVFYFNGAKRSSAWRVYHRQHLPK